MGSEIGASPCSAAAISDMVVVGGRGRGRGCNLYTQSCDGARVGRVGESRMKGRIR